MLQLSLSDLKIYVKAPPTAVAGTGGAGRRVRGGAGDGTRRALGLPGRRSVRSARARDARLPRPRRPQLTLCGGDDALELQ